MSSDAKIRRYLVEVEGMTPVFAEDYLDGLKKHEKDYQEFLETIEKLEKLGK